MDAPHRHHDATRRTFSYFHACREPSCSAIDMERMRLFRRAAQDTKTSVIRREGVSATADAGSMPVVPAAPVSSRPSTVRRPDLRTDLREEEAPKAEAFYDGFEDSDVFLCKDENRPSALPVVREVTLFVHGWSQVEPGLLSWTFQDLRSALDAVQRMKNAIAWCIVSGTGWEDLDTARASGKILVEQVS